MALSKKEIEQEVKAISENIGAHEAQMKLHEYGIKVDTHLKTLLEKELSNRKI